MSDHNTPDIVRNILLIAPVAAIQLALFRLLVPPGFLNGDVAWFVMVADEVVFGGQRLYVDFVEPNAPLASLVMTPAATFHRWAGLSVADATTAWILALTGISFALAFPLTRRLSLKPGQLLLAQGLLLWTMLILPGLNFGQRESLFAMLATPYVLAAALRGTPTQIGTGLALPIGAAAAIGVGVKPPMALGLLAVELASLIRTRRLFHTEAIVMALCLLLYALATLLVFPLYFELMQGWATSLYFAYSSMPGYTYPTLFIVLAAAMVAGLCAARRPRADVSARVLRWTLAAAAIGSFVGFLYFAYSSMAGFSYPTKFIVLAAAMVAAFCAARGPVADPSARVLPWTLAAAAIGSFVGFLLQWKGWVYQALPAHYFATLALASSLTAMAGSTLLRLMQVAIVGLSLSASGLILPMRQQQFTWRPNEDILQAAGQTEGTFLVLSTNVHRAFPEAAEIGRRWALRYPCLILLPGLVQSERRNGGVIEERYRRAEADFVAAITDDLRRHQPSLVMVPKGQDQALPDGITGLDWLLRSRSFAEEWNHYREQGSSERYRIFRRVRPAV